MEQPRKRHRCSACGSAEVWDQGGSERAFHAVPIGSKPVRLKRKVPRVLCFDCGKVRQVKLGFADPGKRYTRAFERYPISTGPLEGTNNKIKTMKRQADGYRDLAFLKLKILGLHETKHALVG